MCVRKLWPLLLVLLLSWACQGEGSYSLHLVFPDDEARDSVAEVNIWALDPGGRSCGQLVSGEIDPEKMTVRSRLVIQFPSNKTLTLTRVPVGDILFFAEGTTGTGAKILRGCSRAEVRSGIRVYVIVSLEWVCRPEPAGEIPNNDIDDDCDGLTDECLTNEDCDDAESCTADFCVAEQCQYSEFPEDYPCSDGNLCTTNDGCLEGLCTGQPKDCGAFDGPCVYGLCDNQTGDCGTTPRQDGDACNDGLYCTQGDSCQAGVCAGTADDCDDGDECTRDECNEGEKRCDNIREPRPGLEGPPADPTCSNGVDDDCDGYTDEQDVSCIGCTQDADCEDANDCTQDACAAQECQNTPVADDAPCSDGLWCTVDDRCEAGVCRSSARDCSAVGDACNDGVCLESEDRCGQQPKSDGVQCDDGSYCTVGDRCNSGACLPVGNRDCDDDDFCTVDGCNEDLDRCDNILQPSPGDEGPPGDSTCSNGADDDCDRKVDEEDPDCQACQTDGDCDDGNPCTLNACNVVYECEMSLQPEGAGCDDGLFCIVNEVCQAGACQGESHDCSGAADQCNYGICNEDSDACEAQPKPDGTSCDDGLFCNMNEACQAGNCSGGAARDCSFLDDQCSQGFCDEEADECRAQPINEGLDCNDGNSCTVGETCQSGVCTGIGCNAPPDSWCDGITLVEYESQGTCVAGSCEYAELRRDCLAGDCVIDHCEVYLVAGFNFEGDANDLRFPDHPPYHNGTVIGATPTADGIRGGAYEFQGQQTRIEVDTFPQIGEGFTWLVWIRARPAAQQPSGTWPRVVSKSIYHQEEGCMMQLGMLGEGVEGRFLVNLFGTDSILYSCGGWPESVFDDQWHHLGLAWSQSGRRIRLYLDGQLHPDCNTPGGGFGVQPSASPLTIGANFDGSVWQYGNYMIDEVYLFDRELTQESIQQIMNTGLTSDNL
jgi:hypothetical protein